MSVKRAQLSEKIYSKLKSILDYPQDQAHPGFVLRLASSSHTNTCTQTPLAVQSRTPNHFVLSSSREVEAIACSERFQYTDFAFIASTLCEMEIDASCLPPLKLEVPNGIAFIRN